VACACLVSALVFPQRVTPALFESSRKNFTNLLGAIHSMLDGKSANAGFDTFVGLIVERSSLESLRSGAVFEDPSMRLQNHVFLDIDRSFIDTVAWIHALHQTQASAAADADPRAAAAVEELIGLLLDVVPEKLLTLEDAETMSRRLAALEADLPVRLGRLLQSLADLTPHQRQFVATTGSALQASIADLRVLCGGYIAARTSDDRPWSQSVIQAITRIGRTRATANRIAATIAGLRAATAVLLVGGAWLASGWVGGSTAIIAVSITSALFALVPNPAGASWQIFGGCLAGTVAGFVFNFFLLPQLVGFELLAATIAIFVMIGSYLNTFTKTATLGLGFSIYFCFIVGISNPTVYNPSAYLDTGFALLLGIATAAIAFSVIVPRAGDWISAQYLKQIRGLVAHMACEGALDDLLYTFERSLRDFIVQIASAPADPRVDRARLIGWAFAALEIGRAMIQMRLDTKQLGDALPAVWSDAEHEWLAALAEVFASVTPQAAERALEATRRALLALPFPRETAVDAALRTRYRMRALLHFAQMTLQDDTLPLKQATGRVA
jgi:uncharacterized membrane protein YccC